LLLAFDRDLDLLEDLGEDLMLFFPFFFLSFPSLVEDLEDDDPDDDLFNNFFFISTALSSYSAAFVASILLVPLL